MPLAAETSRRPSKTQSKSIGKIRRPPPEISRLKNIGRPRVRSEALLRGRQARRFRGRQAIGACSGRRSSPLRNHRTCCRSGRRACCIVNYPNEATTPDESTTTAELTGIPGWPDHRVDASKWRKCKRPPDAEPRRPPHSLSEVPIPASCRSPLDLQMRSCLEYVRDFRALPLVPRELGCCRLPTLWRTS